ncbi:uncharacterized protein E5676_scaffold14G001170 [Cucumis melo var. makuwa]|uniref:Uncharacterized protein n=1 Tax=Cucumis melo var. makuwa TaxID=1194695 RepID=A0A5D3DS95_CUCMM|nr:uncharacterized protein E6C27_scaffold38G001540 [Cucumis melo var. makuwa]TYK26332.1 uncharacterized protein E5676_scaffold14G001170 [Cucumis melo var. makuwa]
MLHYKKSPNLFDIVSSVCVVFIVARKSSSPLLSACRFVVARGCSCSLSLVVHSVHGRSQAAVARSVLSAQVRDRSQAAAAASSVCAGSSAAGVQKPLLSFLPFFSPIRRHHQQPPLTFFFFLTNCRPQSLPSFFFNHAPPILDLYSRHRPPSQAITFLPAVVQPSLRLPILEAQSSSVALKPLLFDQPSPSHANPSRTLCIPPPCLVKDSLFFFILPGMSWMSKPL